MICLPSPPTASTLAVQRLDAELGGPLPSVRKEGVRPALSQSLLVPDRCLIPWGPWEAGELCSPARGLVLSAQDGGGHDPAHTFRLHCAAGSPGVGRDAAPRTPLPAGRRITRMRNTNDWPGQFIKALLWQLTPCEDKGEAQDIRSPNLGPDPNLEIKLHPREKSKGMTQLCV